MTPVRKMIKLLEDPIDLSLLMEDPIDIDLWVEDPIDLSLLVEDCIDLDLLLEDPIDHKPIKPIKEIPTKNNWYLIANPSKNYDKT